VAPVVGMVAVQKHTLQVVEQQRLVEEMVVRDAAKVVLEVEVVLRDVAREEDVVAAAENMAAQAVVGDEEGVLVAMVVDSADSVHCKQQGRPGCQVAYNSREHFAGDEAAL
jgi:hypothetical protein